MSAVPTSEPGSKSRIGDILLAHGFVTQEELADAVLEQERTHQPLGQVLVQRGSITRLELASALAEQWSDPAASIMSSSTRSAPAPAPSAQDEAQYAARLQEAVADLARRVQSTTPLEGIDERVEELSRRIEATFARTQHIEAAVATLAESLEGVTGGVEEAFYALQSGTADLAGDLARLDRSVGELLSRDSAPGADDGPTYADIEELRAAVAAVGEQRAPDDDLRERVDALAAALASAPEPGVRREELDVALDEIAARLERTNDDGAVEELRRSLNGLDARVGSLAALPERVDRLETTHGGDELRMQVETQAATIDGLRTIVHELRSRPAGDPELVGRLAGLEARLDDSAGATERLAMSVEDLERRGGEQPRDPRVDGVFERLGRLEARVSDGLTAMSELRTAVEHRPESAPDPRVDELGGSVDAMQRELAELAVAALAGEEAATRLQALADRVDLLSHQGPDSEALDVRLREVEGRLADEAVTPEHVSRAIEEALQQRPASVDDDRFSALEVRLDAIAADREQEPASQARLAALEAARSADLDTIEVLANALDRVRHELGEVLKPTVADTSAIEQAVEGLSRRIEQVERAGDDRPDVSDASAELKGELERFRLVLERVGLHLAEHDRALADLGPSRGAAQRIDELAGLVESLTRDGGPTDPSPRAAPASGDVEVLLRRVEEAETASQSDNERLLNRLERMAASIDWRLQRLETETTAGE